MASNRLICESVLTLWLSIQDKYRMELSPGRVEEQGIANPVLIHICCSEGCASKASKKSSRYIGWPRYCAQILWRNFIKVFVLPTLYLQRKCPHCPFILISSNVNITVKTLNSPHQMPNVVTEKSDLMAQTTPTNITLIWWSSVLLI